MWFGRREVAVFAHVIRLPDLIFEMEDESAILVTVNKTLSVLVPANLSRSATYLDIPFDRISKIKMSKSDSQSQRRSQHSQSQTTTPCCMDIELKESSGWSHLMNHKARRASSIGIVFDYMPDAIAVNEALAARQAVSHDDNVSPSQLQYGPLSPVTESSTDRQNRLFASEQAASMRVLQAIEADAITCPGDDEAHGNIAISRGESNMGTPQRDRNTVLDSAHIPPQVEVNQNPDGDTNSVTAELEILPPSRNVNSTHPPTAGDPHTQEKSQVHIGDSQQGSESDPPNDSSPQGPKLKHLRNIVNPPVLKEQNDVHQIKTTKGNNKGLSRTLRDQNGLLANAEHVQSHVGDSPGAYTETCLKQASVTGGAYTARDRPQTQGASKARNNIVNSEIPGQRGSDFQKPEHNKVYGSVGNLDQGGKKSRAFTAPEASMVAQPNNDGLHRKRKVPVNTSNTSRPRPKPQIQSTQVLQRPSGSKVKKAKSPNDEEQVDWFEDIVGSDESPDNAAPTRNRTARKPHISIPTEPKKRKTARARNKEVVLNKSATSRSGPQKPRRAAAVKADMKIRGLSDPLNTGPSLVKKTLVKNTADIESASETAPSSGVKPDGKPDVSVKISNKAKKTALRLEKDLSRQPPNVRAPATSISSPTPPESSPSPDHRQSRKSDPLPAHGVMKLTNPPMSNGDVSLPVKRTELAQEGLVEPDAVLLDAMLTGIHEVDKNQSMVEIATEQYAMIDSPGYSEESPLYEKRHPHAKSDRTFLRPQARNTVATLRKPKAIMSDTIEETSPVPAPSELKSHIINSRQPEKNRGGFSGVHVDNPWLLNDTSKLSYLKPRFSNDIDQSVPAFSEHLLSPSVAQNLNHLVTKDEAKKHSTKSERGFTARKLEAALSPLISLQMEDHDVEARSVLQVAHDGKMFGETGKEVRSIGVNVEHQAPNDSTVKATEKRRIGEEDPRQVKKSRVAGWQPQQDRDAARAEIRTPKNNVPELRRKPVVVHFETSGPKYERTQPPRKSKVPAELTMPQSKQDQHSNVIQSNKRKPLDTANDDPWTMDDLPDRKRRKGGHTKMQPISRDITDALAVNPAISSSTRQVHRHGSQSSRVNEQGSPMPTVYSRKMNLAIPKVIAPTKKIPKFLSDISGNGGYYNFDDDAPQTPEPRVLAARQDTLAPIGKMKAVAGRNTKHRPSSPNAPSSIIADMTAHRIQPSGQFVGIQSNDVVVPQKPQDPFVETAHNRPASKFIEILRKSSNEQKIAEDVNDNGHHKDRNIATHLGGNDPDKTLIEGNLSDAEEESSTTSTSSSSSSGSGSQSQADAEPSDNGSGSDAAWKKALRDDQRDIFEKLEEISHVDVCCHSWWSHY